MNSRLLFCLCLSLSGLPLIGLIGCGSAFSSAPPSMSGAASATTGTDNTITAPSMPPQPIPQSKDIPLVWESGQHPERAEWSARLKEMVKENLDRLDLARDLQTFCPALERLTRAQRINLWADLIAATAYYESGWNPRSYSVDVGTNDDADTWSVGLLQLSVVDQSSYRLKFGYDFNDLQDPIKNLRLGVAILAAQIERHGLILIPVGHSGLYWATLHPGGKYDQTARIAERLRHLDFCATD
jgi:hypothetical protein